jgi:hypothetical protein
MNLKKRLSNRCLEMPISNKFKLLKGLVPGFLGQPVRDRWSRHAWARRDLPIDLQAKAIQLNLGARPAGFFSNFFQVVGAIDICEHFEWDLNIRFDKGAYFDPMVGEDWWSSYFARNTFQYCKSGSATPFPVPHSYNGALSEHGKRLASKIAHQIVKRIPIHQHILEQVDSVSSDWEPGVVGVHYRGTDKVRTESVRVPYEFVADQLDLRFRSDTRFFVATDEAAFHEFIQGRFPGRIYHSDAVCGSGEIPPHKDPDNVAKRHQIGREALVECLLLAKCKVLVRTDSNLSQASLFFNPKAKCFNLSDHFR